ncbi:hypothetical protein KAS79_01730 [Candidatus Parcubacteria bacterium]|nr:hypothetical protein [Candidatus Parcubacteria bacterium]
MENEKDIVRKAKEIMEMDGLKEWPVVSTEIVKTIPYFGKVIKQIRNVNGEMMDYYNILRHFGWSVTFGVTADNQVLTLIQWKPGVNQASWELPPGGIGKIDEEAELDLIQEKTKEFYQKETGYGNGKWKYLGYVIIETGKYRGATVNSHGLKAHLWLATELEKISDTTHAAEEKITMLPVPLNEFMKVLDSGMFVETSAVCCAYKALLKLGILQ